MSVYQYSNRETAASSEQRQVAIPYRQQTCDANISNCQMELTPLAPIDSNR